MWMVLYNGQVSMSHFFTLAAFGYKISVYSSVQGVFVEGNWKGERGTNGGKLRLEGDSACLPPVGSFSAGNISPDQILHAATAVTMPAKPVSPTGRSLRPCY